MLAFPAWETRVQSLIGPLLKVLKQLRRKSYLYIDISKWLDFRVFSDKDVKIVAGSVPYQFGKSLLGNRLTTKSKTR
jgi:hypothetical protein